jgi:hypothetical protein
MGQRIQTGALRVTGVTMDKNYYKRDQAMELLGLRSINVFFQLARKNPEVFANVNPKGSRDRNPWYDKTALGKFVALRECVMQELK